MNKTTRLQAIQVTPLSSWALVGISFLTLVTYLFLFLVPISLDTGNPFWVLAGRFHPLILHFPIVLILLITAAIILAQLKPRMIHPTLIRVLMGVSVVASMVAIGAGYLLYLSEAYSGSLVKNHFYGALITGSSLSITVLCYELRPISGNLFRPLFWFSLPD